MTQGKAKPARPPEPQRSAVANRRDRAGDGSAHGGKGFPIVIGASAGGLDAFRKFFAALPADSGLAFVLIQHLDPTRHSLTAELMGTYTHMRVMHRRIWLVGPRAGRPGATLRFTLPLQPPGAARKTRST